jgi:peroxiredoxin
MTRQTAAISMCVALCVCQFAPAWAGKFNKRVSIGEPAPQWAGLEGIDGKPHSRDDYKDAPVLVLAFICNHCPVAAAYEDRLIQLTKDFKSKKVAVVAINCNTNEADRLDKMKARAEEQGFNFDYLYDPSQQTARALGATVTPHLFVLDKNRKIAYMGAFDDNLNPAKVETRYVREAVEALLAGKPPEVAESFQFGCAIQYEAQEKE